jgi:hypothetical protein
MIPGGGGGKLEETEYYELVPGIDSFHTREDALEAFRTIYGGKLMCQNHGKMNKKKNNEIQDWLYCCTAKGDDGERSCSLHTCIKQHGKMVEGINNFTIWIHSDHKALETFKPKGMHPTIRKMVEDKFPIGERVILTINEFSLDLKAFLLDVPKDVTSPDHTDLKNVGTSSGKWEDVKTQVIWLVKYRKFLGNDNRKLWSVQEATEMCDRYLLVLPKYYQPCSTWCPPRRGNRYS